MLDAMKISFVTKKLERQLSGEKEMKKAFGHVMPALKLRLSLLRSVSNLSEVPHTRPEGRHLLHHDWSGHFAVWLSANYRLIFRPDHDPVPLSEDGGGFDIHAITAVEIAAIEDYHGK